MPTPLLDPASLVLLLVTWPLILNLLSVIRSKYKRSFYALSICSTTALGIGTFLHGPMEGSIPICRWIVFTLDTPSWTFVVLVYLCWAITLVYSIGYISTHLSLKAQTFHRFMGATLGLSAGAGMADNFFTLLFFYMASIPTIYPLPTLRDEDEGSHKAARFYLKSTLWPPLFIAIPAISFAFPLDVPFDRIHVQQLGWSHWQYALLLALIIIGLSKNCVAPFTQWLPQSSIAPAPVTAMIHSVAAVQIASIALFKIAKHVYGYVLLSELCDHFLETGWLLYLCGGTAVYTAVQA